MMEGIETGAVSAPMEFTVHKDAVRRFAEALGDPHPAYRTGDAVPPTFPTTFRVQVPGLKLDLTRVLHTEEEYVYTRPLRVGDRVTVTRRLVQAQERRGRFGTMILITSEIEGRDPTGAPIFTGRTTLVVRQGEETVG